MEFTPVADIKKAIDLQAAVPTDPTGRDLVRYTGLGAALQAIYRIGRTNDYECLFWLRGGIGVGYGRFGKLAPQ